MRVNKSVLAACFQLFHCKDSLNLSVIHSVGGKINYKLSFRLQLPVAGCCFVSHQHSFAYKLESNRAPKRRFASVGNLFTGHCHPLASIRNHFTGHRVPSAGRVGAYCIRPIKWPRRGQIRRRRIPVGRYCFLPGTCRGVCNTPLHGRPTMADDVRSPPSESIL